MAIDKRGVLTDPTRRPFRIELGCGEAKRDPNTLGLDIVDTDHVDILGDCISGLSLFPEGSVDHVASYHFVEHVDDLEGLLKAIDRVLAPGGRVEIVVPHFSNPHFYSDPTHRRMFGLYTFSYFCQEQLLRRRVPQFYEFALPWKIVQIQLYFTTDRVFPIRSFIRRALGKIIGNSYTLMEHYEDTLCWIFPCYEIRFHVEKIG